MTHSRLANLKAKQQQLQQDYLDAIEGRKKTIGQLAERYHLLEESDAFFRGLFQQTLHRLQHEPSYREHFEQQGFPIKVREKPPSL